MLTIIHTLTDNIFRRTLNGCGKLFLAQLMNRSNISESSDLAKVASSCPLQNGLYMLLALIIVGNEIEHRIGGQQLERSSRQINVNHLISLYKAEVWFRDSRSRKTDKFHAMVSFTVAMSSQVSGIFYNIY